MNELKEWIVALVKVCGKGLLAGCAMYGGLTLINFIMGW